MDLCRS